jgi:hypothetical protein
MQALETNEGGHLRCGNTLKKLEKMEKYRPNAKDDINMYITKDYITLMT